MAFKQVDGIWQFDSGVEQGDEPQFSVGDWNINPGGSRFVAPRRKELSLAKKAALICEAGAQWMEFHSTEAPRKDAKKILRTIEKEGLSGVHMVTANLFKLDRYTNGNFGNPDPAARKAAIKDTKDYIAAGIEDFDAKVYVYWNSSNGTNVRCGVNYRDLYLQTAECINEIVGWMVEKYGPEKSLAFCIESKPNEPRAYSLPANIGEALTIKSMVNRDLQPFVGVNPEMCHSHMSGLNYAAELGLAMAAKSLFHVHLNGGPEFPMWDTDFAFGDGNLNAAFETVLTLEENGYGHVYGIDVQPLSTDRDDQQAASIERSISNFSLLKQMVDSMNTAELEDLRADGDQAAINDFLTQTLTNSW